MAKDSWKNPDDGVVHENMDKPVNKEHEKIRRKKIKEGEKTAKEKEATIHEKKKRGPEKEDAITDALTRERESK